MKKLLNILMMVAVIAFAASCGDPSDPVNPVDPESLNAVKTAYTIGAEGGSVELQVSANIDVTATCPESWVHINTTKATETKKISVTVDANTSTESRSAKVTVQGKEKKVEITINQEGAEPEPPVEPDVLEAGTTTYSVAAEGGEVNVAVTTNVDMTVTTDAGWIKYTSTKAASQKTVCFMVEANTAYEARSGKATISGGDKTIEIVFNQAAAEKPDQPDQPDQPTEDPELSAGQATYTVPAAGQDIVVDVTTNIDYTVSCDAQWITKVATKASRVDHITFTVAANEGEARSAEIKFIYEDITVVVTVSQEAYVAPAEDPVLEVSATEFQVAAAGEELNVKVTHNYDYTVSGNPEWVVVDIDGDDCFITVVENTETEARVATLEFVSEGLKKTVAIAQEAAEAGPGDPLDVGSNLSKNETANTYVVTKAGDYTFDASVMGNGPDGYLEAWIEAQESLPEDKSFYLYPIDRESVTFSKSDLKKAKAAIIWEEGDCLDGDPKYNSTDKTIAFKANGNEGGALIALYNQYDDVLWSWLIWCTDRPAEFTYTNSDGDHVQMMDRNLGATSASPEDGRATFGYGFNFGRKDPIRMEHNMAKTMIIKNTDKDYLTTVLNPTMFIDYVGRDIEYFNGSVETLTPDLWGDPYFPYCKGQVAPARTCFDQTDIVDVHKTIYDPCPPGYQVPPGRVFDNIKISDVHLVSDLGVKVDVEDGSTYFPFAGYGDAGDSHGQDNGWYGYPGFTNNGYREGVYCVKVWTATEGDYFSDALPDADLANPKNNWLGGQAFSVSYNAPENNLSLIQHPDDNLGTRYNEHCIRVRLQSVRCMRYVEK